MLFRSIFATLLAFCFTISQTVATSKSITWLLANNANPTILEPAGEDINGTLYVARVRVEGEWIPGKGYYRANSFYATVGFMGEDEEFADCQALMRGSTKWVQPKRGRLPADAVLAGKDPMTYERTYVCRGFAIDEGKSWLMVGKLLENSFICRLPFNGETIASSFEVLVYYY